MKKTKWFASLCMSLILIMSMLLTACGQNSSVSDNKGSTGTAGTAATTAGTDGKTATVDTSKPYVLQYYSNDATVKMASETAVGKIMKEKFNFDVEFVPYTGSFDEKCALMLAAGDYPEYMMMESDAMLNKYIDAKAYYPTLEKLIDTYGPDFKAWHKDALEINKIMKNGELAYFHPYYGDIGNLSDISGGGSVEMSVRTDVLEAMGWPKLSREDDWVKFIQDALKKFPETDGKKTIGITFIGGETWSWGLPTVITRWRGIDESPIVGTAVSMNMEKGEFVDRISSPSFKQGLQFYNKLQRAGVLDQESFTNKFDQVTEKMNAGRPIVVINSYYNPNMVLEAAGKQNMEYLEMPIVLDTQVGKPEGVYCAYPGAGAGWGTMMMTKNCKQPERLMQVMNWTLSAEGRALNRWGIAGEDYEIKDGKKVLTSAFLDNCKKDAKYLNGRGIGILDFLGATSIKYDENKQLDSAIASPEYKMISTPARIKDAWAKYGAKDGNELWKNLGIDKKPYTAAKCTSCTLDSGSEEATIESKVQELCIPSFTKLILAKSEQEFNSTWDEFVGNYNKLNTKKVVDKYNQIYKDIGQKLPMVKDGWLDLN